LRLRLRLRLRSDSCIIIIIIITRLNSTQLNSTRLNSTQLDSTRPISKTQTQTQTRTRSFLSLIHLPTDRSLHRRHCRSRLSLLQLLRLIPPTFKLQRIPFPLRGFLAVLLPPEPFEAVLQCMARCARPDARGPRPSQRC